MVAIDICGKWVAIVLAIRVGSSRNGRNPLRWSWPAVSSDMRINLSLEAGALIIGWVSLEFRRVFRYGVRGFFGVI